MHPDDAARRRSVRAGIATVVAVVAVAVVGHQVVAEVAYAQAWPKWAAADTRYDEAGERLDEAVDLGTSELARAESLLEAPTGDLVADEDRAALEATALEATAVVRDEPAGATGIATLSDPGELAPAWERYGDLWELVELIPDRVEAAARLSEAADRVEAGTEGLSEAVGILVAGATEAAASALEASPSATYRTRAALEAALDPATGGSDAASESATRITALATAVTDVRASHAAEEQRRRDHPVRAEIEDFARSIAQGVEIDVVWDYVVNGYSSDAWYSGTAEFFEDGDGWGLLSLSESIEEAWTLDPNAKAVVVHEVGHVQVLREECAAIFSGSEFQEDHEAWATAWAIGMGYDLPGAGIDAYGRPTDAQIAAAAECR